MSTGFNNMSIVHRIDELIFDWSCNSMIMVQQHEAEMSNWVTEKLLPALDEILNEFDEKGSVWRINQIEIDLGDILDSDSYIELMQCFQTKLSDELRALQQKYQFSGSERTGNLPIQQFSKTQSDLMNLYGFLRTGRMPWHIDATDSYAHEKMLLQVLQEELIAEIALARMLRSLPATDRTAIIKRLVSQFSQQHLEKILLKIESTYGHLILEFLVICHQVILKTDAILGTQTEKRNSIWIQLLEILFEDAQPLNNPARLIDQLINRQQMCAPHFLLQNILRTAEQHQNEGKISSALYDLLRKCSEFLLEPHLISEENSIAAIHRKEGSKSLGDKASSLVEESEEAKIIYIPPIMQQLKPVLLRHGLLYQRIFKQLRKAKLTEESVALVATERKPDEFRQQLRELLRSPAMLARLIDLPQSTLLEITYLLTPQAAFLMERVLALADHLYRSSSSDRRDTQAQWQQRLWTSSLAYLLTETDAEFEPATYLLALVRGVSDEADLQSSLRSWHDQLSQSKAYGTLYTLLQTLIIGTPERNPTIGSAADSTDEVFEESIASQRLRRHFTAGKSELDSGQQDLQTILEALAADNPTELKRIYQNLRDGRYALTVAQLQAHELRNLVEMLLKTKTSITGSDRMIFQQAIENQASQATDQKIYYRRLLDDLLHDREIDLEAIATVTRRTEFRNVSDGAAEHEETKSESIDTQSVDKSKEPRQLSDEMQYERILTALRKAQLVEAGTGTVRSGMRLDELRQQLCEVLRMKELRIFVDRLPQSVLFEMVCFLSPQAALLIEHLLIHADKLHRTSQITASDSQQQWINRLWLAGLDYLLTKTDSDLKSTTFLLILVRGVSDEADLQSSLRSWHDQLSQSKAYGTLYTLLQTLIIGTPERNPTIGSAADSTDEVFEESIASQRLRRHFTAGKSELDSGQQDLQTILEALAADNPTELKRIYQNLRDGRYALTVAQLQAHELRNLVEMLLKTKTSITGSDRMIFQQAIENQASQATDQKIYYRRLLDDLLHDREIDLEAIATVTRRTEFRNVSDGAAEHEETKSESIDTQSVDKSKEPRQLSDEMQYERILTALRKAQLVEAGTGTVRSGMRLDELRQQLCEVLRMKELRIFVDRLPQSVLFEMVCFLSPQAALLIEHLLIHADKLHRTSQITASDSQQQWINRLWLAGLDYLLTKTDSDLKSTTFLLILVRGVSDEADLQSSLRSWHDQLSQSKAYGTLYTLLQTLIIGTPERNPTIGSAADSTDEVFEESIASQRLRRHFTAGKSELDSGQQDLQTILEALAADNPTELKRIYQNLRDGRYALTVAQLQAHELRNLVEMLLKTKTSITGSDRMIFQQAIENQASQATDQKIYYRRLLDDLLHDREIDLEAIATVTRRTEFRNVSDGAAEHEETKSESIDTQSVDKSKEPRQLSDEMQYERILTALRKAQLVEAGTGTVRSGMRLDELRQQLCEVLRMKELRIFVDRLPQSVLFEMVCFLSPQAALLIEHLLIHADKLHRTSQITASDSQQQWINRLWLAGLDYLLTKAEREFELTSLLHALIRHVSVEAQLSAALHVWHAALMQNNAEGTLSTLIETAIFDAVVSESIQAEKNVFDAKQSMPIKAAQSLIDLNTLFNRLESDLEANQEIYIENAGLVLAAPYLPRLFSLLNLIEEGQFVDYRAAERAVHLLQFMVNEQMSSPEYQLTLNKILCGISIGTPICSQIEISVHEQEAIEGLIHGMIHNWKTIGNTSISGLRETFLQRKGRLQLTEEGMWYLTIEPGVFDMLLDGLPWSFSVIRHTWMDHPVHVSWR
ncbi:contractile injection system tape measure protein [Nitrosomonas supralitoralis]|uniref:Uncharacterized protein n=1 Tax=Nitrosomonas supralitoralis TaxID=2116706 RepID=A0A2P7NZP3_9PROT|nr:contractile injection system tape measure protein [Nitrosomonas supralitoralis]PSJ18959.1 hypothetical protein C7H79_00565 [Nitrosomonas supralitoralis]